MFRAHCAAYIFAVISLAPGLGIAQADSGAPAAGNSGVAVEDFAYVDTSGEAADQAAVHTAQLQAFMAALRGDFQRDRQYHLVAVSCGMDCMDAELPDLAHAAAGAGAKIVVIGGIHKMSTLVQWARVEVIDVAANRIVLDRLFTFRGDSDQAWDRAEAFIFREIHEALAVRADQPGHPGSSTFRGQTFDGQRRK